ncbi:Fic/DOC family protein [Zavarzinia compransoris]|nr:Fic family protein [Zavarzinia compransoris]TDP45708.1 fido (protein-threonine AMPylation protein) [Zavarzinia compransoris]
MNRGTIAASAEVLPTPEAIDAAFTSSRIQGLEGDPDDDAALLAHGRGELTSGETRQRLIDRYSTRRRRTSTKDPYLLSTGALRNRLGISDPATLERAEKGLVDLRMARIDIDGPRGAYTFARLKETHRYLFQDLYDWAGEARTVTLAKAGFDRRACTAFARPADIEPIGHEIFGRLGERNALKGLSRPDFVDSVTGLFADVNMLHPFREGNGRTQEAFVKAIGCDAGHPIDLGAVTLERMIRVSIDATGGDRTAMRQMFSEATDPRQVGILNAAIAAIATRLHDWNERFIAITTPGQHYEGVLAGVSRQGDTFLFRTDVEIFVGWARDLPASARSGDRIAFGARGAPSRVA